MPSNTTRAIELMVSYCLHRFFGGIQLRSDAYEQELLEIFLLAKSSFIHQIVALKKLYPLV